MNGFAPMVELEGRCIGPGRPVFVIAEIGINHNGDLDLARRSVDAAAEAGADCVKFQTFRAEEFMADRELEYEYLSAGTPVREKMYEMFKRLELPFAWHRTLFEHARSRGLVPLTSVADPLCVEAALEAGAGAFKLASEDLINLPLLDSVAARGLPLILSTGMADEEEIADALDVLRRRGADRTIFLHCVSLYPTRDEETNLRRMTALARVTGAVTGYSDHTLGSEACLAAVALGACVLEKHFTLDRSLPGPDHSLSADPWELADLVRSVRRVEAMLGGESLEIAAREREFRHAFRRSVVAARPLRRGTVLTADDLTLKRPGSGLRAREIPRLLGRVLDRDLPGDAQIAWGMLQTERNS
ncbi:MAG: N-acetylneuraminate synthase family protein [Desulfovibrio aminophilus]|uniref:N-acetylneuraminate synthase family protein n=1 Tax=Desulfovibrio aminophilus TaxID=81425 RepID=UPI0039E74345